MESAVFTDEYIQNLEITPEKGIDLISRFSFHLNYISYIVYCVHGHEVSQQATARPSDRRYRARYLEGGHHRIGRARPAASLNGF